MVDIIKSSGETEEFNREKFCSSLRKAGASEDVVSKVCGQVETEITKPVTTEDIFEAASKRLRHFSPAAAVRYNIKRGIRDLGPAGFLFEQYFEEVLRAYGYETKRNQIMEGVCVPHEVDILAYKDAEHYLIEAKYRNDPKTKTDVTVVMYAQARLEDIRPVEEKHEKERKKHEMWVVTNAKFTSYAIRYAQCKNIKLTGWSYPRGESLEDLINAKQLYPVTALPSVSTNLRALFSEEKIMLVKDIAGETPQTLAERLGIDAKRSELIMEEVHSLGY